MLDFVSAETFAAQRGGLAPPTQQSFKCLICVRQSLLRIWRFGRRRPALTLRYVSKNEVFSMLSCDVRKIRPEQMSHAKYLRRGRGSRSLPIAILTICSATAAIGVVVALS